VARGTQHRKRRPQTNARVAAQTASSAPKRPKRPAYEEQLFFGRLRNHAKIVFVLLAAVFVISFVFLGVGSGSTGISQIVSNFFSGSSSSGKSESSLQKQTVEHPKSAAAWLAYANKLQQDNKFDDAATALTTYTKLNPKNTDQLRVLASIYLRRAQDWNTIYSNQRLYTQTLTPAPLLTPKPTSPLGKALATVTSPLATAVSTQTNSAVGNAYQQVISFLSQRETVDKRLATLLPKDATTQLELAQAAGDANDTAAAILAYKAFLKLAPSDSSAPAARTALKALEKASASSAASAGAGATATTKSGKG
jgi:DNA-binding SARP family transcriptional activator